MNENLDAEASDELPLSDPHPSKNSERPSSSTSTLSAPSDSLPSLNQRPQTPKSEHQPIDGEQQSLNAASERADSDIESEVVGMVRRRGKKARRAQARNLIVEEDTPKDFESVSPRDENDSLLSARTESANSQNKSDISKREKRRAKELAKKQNSAQAELGPKADVSEDHFF